MTRFVDPQLTPLLPAPGATARRRQRAVQANGGWSDVRIPMSEIPVLRDAEPQALVLTLYGDGKHRHHQLASADSIVTRDLAAGDIRRAEYRAELRRAPFDTSCLGWSVLVLRVQQAPAVDAVRPPGPVIAVDAGHPPAGSTGPGG